MDVLHREVMLAIDDVDVEQRGDVVVVEQRNQAPSSRNIAQASASAARAGFRTLTATWRSKRKGTSVSSDFGDSISGRRNAGRSRAAQASPERSQDASARSSAGKDARARRPDQDRARARLGVEWSAAAGAAARYGVLVGG